MKGTKTCLHAIRTSGIHCVTFFIYFFHSLFKFAMCAWFSVSQPFRVLGATTNKKNNIPRILQNHIQWGSE